MYVFYLVISTMKRLLKHFLTTNQKEFRIEKVMKIKIETACQMEGL